MLTRSLWHSPRVLLAFACIVLLLGTHGVALARSREKDYVHQDSSRFRVWYCPEDAGVVPELWHVFYDRVPLIELQLRLALRDTVNFVITPSKAEWHRLTGGAPLWANGLAIPARKTAVLKSPRFSHQYGPIANTAVHEYVHLLTQSGASGMDLPRWLDEGMAEVLAGQLEFANHTLLGRAVAAGRLHTFAQTQMLMSMREQEAQLAYSESAIAVEFLVTKYGWPGVANLISQLRTGESFDAAFLQIFGIGVGTFESEYMAYVTKQYRLSWITDTEIWVSGLFVVGVFAAGIAAWMRRRRTLKRWEDEHSAESVGETNSPRYVVNYEIIRSRREDEEREDPT